MKSKIYTSLIILLTIVAGTFIGDFRATRRIPMIGTAFYVEESDSVEVDPMVMLINKERLKVNSPMLDNSPLLYESAHLKSQHMCSNNYFSHMAPDGTTPWEFFRVVGYNYRYAGENLSHNISRDKRIVEEFVLSETHREIMLDRKFREVGIGRCGEYVTVHFGTLIGVED